MVFEDIHWSDPTTRESLDLLIDRIPILRVLLILTLRPDFAPPWVGRPQVTLLSLNRLPPRQRAKMIAHVSGGKPLPKEIADQIIDRIDGVPLFVEELTKAVIERRAHGYRGAIYGDRARCSPRDPDEPPRFASGTARPPGAGARGGANRRGAWAVVLARTD